MYQVLLASIQQTKKNHDHMYGKHMMLSIIGSSVKSQLQYNTQHSIRSNQLIISNFISEPDNLFSVINLILESNINQQLLVAK